MLENIISDCYNIELIMSTNPPPFRISGCIKANSINLNTDNGNKTLKKYLFDLRDILIHISSLKHNSKLCNRNISFRSSHRLMTSKDVSLPYMKISLIVFSMVFLPLYAYVFDAYGQQGGNAVGGNAVGGNAQGGDATGGNAVGGNAQGGDATGGNAMGGDATSANLTSNNSLDLNKPINSSISPFR
jgi:hypothetical protein